MIRATHSSFTSTSLMLKAYRGSSSAFNLIHLTRSSLTTPVSTFSVRGDGYTTIHSGGLDVTGGATIQGTGGLTVSTGGTTVSNSGGTGIVVSNGAVINQDDGSSAVLTLQATDTSFDNTVFMANSC